MLPAPPPFSLPFKMNIPDRRCLLCLRNHAYETPSNQNSQYSKFESQPCMLSLSRLGVYGFSNGNTFYSWEAQKHDGHVICLIRNRNCRCLCLFPPKRSKHFGHAVCLWHPACGWRISQHRKLLSGLRKLRTKLCVVFPLLKRNKDSLLCRWSLWHVYISAHLKVERSCACVLRPALNITEISNNSSLL